MNMISTQLLDLPWEHVICEHILSRVNIKTCFLLRQVSIDMRLIIKLYFARLKEIKLSRSEFPTKIPQSILQVLLQDNSVCNTLILNIRFTSSMNDKGLICDIVLPLFFDRCNRLRNIDFTGCNCITSSCLMSIAKQCTQLETLNLSSCHWADIEDVCEISSCCSKLQSLNLSSLWSVNDDVVITIASNCRQLNCLSLENVYSITDRSIYQLCRCVNLRELNIIGCWRVSDRAIQTLAEFCVNLAMLSVLDCPGVSELSLGRLRQRGILLDVPPRKPDNRYFYPQINLQI